MSATTMSRAVRRRWWWTLWSLLTTLAIGIAAYFVPPYLVGSTNIPNLDMSIPGYYTSLLIHGVPAGLALVIGPWQFVPRLRARFPRAHRIAGRVYLISVLAAALAALYSAAVTPSGFTLQVAFFGLVVVWLYTAAKAYLAIRRREVQLHRIWMVRNYAFTFAAVTLRLYQLAMLPLLDVIPSLEYSSVYESAAWLSLLGNVLVAEYFIVQRTLAPLARRQVSEQPAEALVHQ
ncbi:DUF2306 domain-containing protein [Nonomuraea sp. NPDC005650]|uniref:DUF2306 domain-containing protein n=1 Tax=Nonomuraea sp. NPDC005650 TaxID=3157045 RepID=UPI0033BEA67A